MRKFQLRNRTAQEYHAKWSFPIGALCSCCGKKPLIRAIVMVPFDEAIKRGMIPPDLALLPNALAPILVPIKEQREIKNYVRISVTYSCKTCLVEFERALAKTPSFAIVEINYGPNPKNSLQLAV